MPAMQHRARTRVLVIGEHPSLRRLVRLNLSKLPIEVREASTSQARELVGWELPHLVILDLHPPLDHGLALCRQLRRDSTTATIPAVALVASGGEHVRSMAKHAGATVCLDKPLRSRTLVDTVQSLIPTDTDNPTADNSDPGIRLVREDEEGDPGLAGARLAARTAHHLLNTPLTLALGYADLIAVDSRLPDDLRGMAGEVRDNVQIAARLLERLLRIDRLEQRDWDLPGGPILDLPESVRTQH
jgi:CheY-like chemotaxis protein